MNNKKKEAKLLAKARKHSIVKDSNDEHDNSNSGKKKKRGRKRSKENEAGESGLVQDEESVKEEYRLGMAIRDMKFQQKIVQELETSLSQLNAQKHKLFWLLKQVLSQSNIMKPETTSDCTPPVAIKTEPNHEVIPTNDMVSQSHDPVHPIENNNPTK